MTRPIGTLLAVSMLIGFSVSFLCAQPPSPDSPASNGSIPEDSVQVLPAHLQKLIAQYCSECHVRENANTDFRIVADEPIDFRSASARSHWSEVVHVLNSHEMPPETAPQPSDEDVSLLADWITDGIVGAERSLRENQVVLRRLNRIEYKNTIRDLVGVDVDVSGFPQDPPASGFDNIGAALSISPMQMELYLDTAQKIMDAALVDREAPSTIRWKFEVDSGNDDSNRVPTDGQNPIVNGGNLPVIDGFKKMHHASWDKTLNVRDFAVKEGGTYVLRIRAFGEIPSRDQVVASAKLALEKRFQDQMKENPKGEKWHREAMERDLEHFRNDRMYDYGPPRLKLIQDLAGQPRTIAEVDIDAPRNAPRIYEFPIPFTTDRAGITIEYAYSIPSVLENFWMQNQDSFARPELYVDWIELEGPIHPQWPPEAHRRCVPNPIDESNEKDRIEETIGRFVRRAFRRPVSRAEVAPYVKIYSEARGQQQSPIRSLRAALGSVLVSPHFLYLIETESNSDTHRINSHQLASRLSYFLWSAPPDAELVQVANQGNLTDDAVLREQTARMLADARSEELVKNFCDQWLSLREIGANPPAPDLYPHYDRHLETSMIEEGRALFRTILREGRHALEFVDPDYVVINERLARFYDVEGVRGDHFRSVPLVANRNRGGILTQAGMLTVTSNGTRTSPVKRGTWILKNILGSDPGLPVANAGDIAPKVPGIDKATVRQRLEIHRQLPQCARCHDKIDPLGLALENFNASGGYREQEGFGYKGRIERDDPRIDASAKLPDGTTVDGPAELKKAIRDQENAFLRCLAQKLLTYSLGRELTLADEPDIRRIVERTKQNQYRLDGMIQEIVHSDSFLSY
ncbi:MAG: DUF1592 domain-containing protein [Planctomycetota bacterium]